MKANLRFHLAQRVCRWIPPILAMRLRSIIYPQIQAFRDDFAFVVRASTGSQFAGRTSDFHGYPFSVHGYYEWRNWALARVLCKPGDTIVEIGANVGTETVGFRDIVGDSGRVFAFEPLPSNLEALAAIVELNHWSNVFVRRNAIGDQEATTTFALPPSRHSSGTGHIIASGKDSSLRTIEVACSRLDSWEQELGSARAIFCDTEGAETLVLRGARGYISRHRPAIILESSPKLLLRAGSSVSELFQSILDAGYVAFRINRLSVTPVTDLDQTGACNWLCLPESQSDLSIKCSRTLLKCALMPCIRRLNPLCC